MDSSNRAESTTVRIPYKTPVLTEYGKLKDLTTGGSGNAQEASSGQKPRP